MAAKETAAQELEARLAELEKKVEEATAAIAAEQEAAKRAAAELEGVKAEKAELEAKVAGLEKEAEEKAKEAADAAEAGKEKEAKAAEEKAALEKEVAELKEKVAELAAAQGAEVLPICAQMEADIVEMEPEEKQLFLAELGLEPRVDHVTDFVQIAAYGVMSTPALVVDGRVVSQGRVLNKAEAMDLIRKARGI